MSRAKAKVTKVCAVCGREFETSRSYEIYCSRACCKKANNAQTCKRKAEECRARREANGGRVCPVCGKRFVPNNGNAVYCSLKCRDEMGNKYRRDYRRAKGSKGHDERVVVCEWCGNEFTARSPRARYCSKHCQKQAWYREHPDKYEQAKAKKRIRGRVRSDASRAERAALERLAREQEQREAEAKRKAHWAKVMAEIHAPIGDDEPLRKYIGS